METQIQEYSPTVAALAILGQKYKGMTYDVTTPAGMSEAKMARNDIRSYRTALEEKRVEIKEPALAKCKLIDTEANRIKQALWELEDPIVAQIQKEESRKEAEKQAAIKAEQDRIEAEQRALREAQEKKLAEERADIARRQEALDKAEREQAEAARQSRLKIESEERAARERIEATERAARKLREDAEAITRKAEQEAEEKERAAYAAEEERQRRERQAKEYAATQLLSARAMLKTFVEKYGEIKEFSKISEQIKAFLKKRAIIEKAK